MTRAQTAASVCVVTTALLLLPVTAGAQTVSTLARPVEPPRLWEIAVHGGFVNAGVPPQGIPTAPGPNPAFTTVNARTSRLVPSWFFGDGANLFNQVRTGTNAAVGLTPLDPMSSAPSGDFGNSWIAGVQVSRALNPRVALEGTFEIAAVRVHVQDEFLPDIEATRASYEAGWTSLFATAPGVFQNSAATATATITEDASRQIMGTGALVINILTRRRNTPYVSGGVGVMATGGDHTSVLMSGHYTTLINGTTLIDESDSLTFRYHLDRTVVSVTVALGWKRAMSPRWGWRVEMREQLSSDPITNVVSASPQLVLTTAPGQQGAAAFNNFITAQFSNIAGSSTQSSLGGSATDALTFTATGMERRLSFTGGLYWRF